MPAWESSEARELLEETFNFGDAQLIKTIALADPDLETL
jgi:hypothetical protein